MKAMTDGAILARLCGNVTAGRFDWRKYCRDSHLIPSI